MPRLLSGGRRRLFIYLLANGVFQAILAVATALLVRYGFDHLVMSPGSLEWQPVSLLLLAMLCSILLTAWLGWRGNLDAESLGQSYIHAVRIRLFRHITAIGADGARQMSRGALMLRFVGDLTALRNWVSLGLARLAVSGVTMGLALLALMLVEPVIGIAVGTAILAAGLLTSTLGPRLRRRTREARRYRGRIAALINDRISHIGVVETFGQEQREIKRIRRASKRLRNALVNRARVIGLLRALSEGSAGFASLLALMVGAMQVAGGHATPGAVVSAMVVAGLLAPRLNHLSRVYEYWNAATIAREKQRQVLRLRPVGRTNKPGGAPFGASSLAKGIQLQQVTKEPLFRSVSLTIEAGERIALIGANGAGKSTLLRIMSGILDPDDGQVLLGDLPIQNSRWSDVRRTFAMVSPDLPLLRGSLRLNLTYGSRDADETEIGDVLRLCQLESLMNRLGRGLDSRIAENGSGLSTGERARISIARALLAKPAVLLLDEAEANLDAVARQALAKAMASFAGTVIYTTHDIRQVAQADRVLAIQSGTVLSLRTADIVADPSAWGLTSGKFALKLVS
jgi:ABC-type multidrug transport system fused ATPase/permease subunit